MALTAPLAQNMGEPMPAQRQQGDDVQFSALCCPHPLSALQCVLCCPCGVLGSLRTIDPNEQAAAIYWGKYVGTLAEPGLYCVNPFGLELRRMSTRRNTLQLSNIKVLDKRGNPIVVNGVVTFAGTSARKATIDVQNPWPDSSWSRSSSEQSFLSVQASAVLKRVSSRFPYEAPAGEPSLQSEGSIIAEMLKSDLQERVRVTGAHIFSFDLVDLSYAPEIAQVMLVRQQAEALVDARRTIVSAAVDMTQMALSALRKGGTTLDESTAQQLTTNLLTVICSERAAVPTVSMNS